MFGTNANLNLTPIDIIENLGDFLEMLDGIYMGAGELRYGDFGFFYDVVYMDVFSAKAIEGRFVSGNRDHAFVEYAFVTGFSIWFGAVSSPMFPRPAMWLSVPVSNMDLVTEHVGETQKSV